jgi:hypothetical protein
VKVAGRPNLCRDGPLRRLRPANAITLTAEPTKEYQAHRLGEADQERLG